MGDSWLQRLVVRGPAAEVTAFRRAVASREKPEYRTIERECATQKLSFAKLRTLIPGRPVRRFDGEVEEPWDLSVDRARRLKDGSLELTYRFQLSAFEPDDLIVEVAKVYPRLCFVIGCVAPNVDEQSSRLVHGGRSWGWRLSSRRKEAIWKQLVPEETDDNNDELLWGEVQADWQMMDEVVAHWRPKMDTLVARVRRLDKAGRKTPHARRHRGPKR